MRKLLAAAVLLACAAGPLAQNNVLVLVADDLGVDYVGCYKEGSSPAPTPNIDALAQRGVLFRNAWAHPSCSPTRASILTGRYAFRTFVGRWIRYPNNSEPIGTLQPREWTLPRVLDAAKSGYAHACIGKWHLSDVTEGLDTPLTSGGFDYFVGHMWGQVSSYYAWPRVENGKETTSTTYATTQQVDDALKWIGQQKQPWLCYLAFTAPHLPFEAPPAHLHTQKLSGLSPSTSPRAFYTAMIEALDTEIGRLLRGLGPELAKTEIIFLGDNGSVQNMAVAPFDPKRAKGSPYEGGINVPLIIAGPAVASPGREVKALACSEDVFSTAIELAGATNGIPTWLQIDGRSLVPYLTSATQTPLRSFAWTEEFTGAQWPKPNTNGHVCVRNDRYKLIYRYGKSDELYDLQADPWEKRNLLAGTLTQQEQQNHSALLNQISVLRTPAASFKVFGGSSCAGSAGIPTLAHNGTPRLGHSFDLTLRGAPATQPALLASGFSAREWLGLPLPLDLRPLGLGVGCELAASIDLLDARLTDQSGSVSLRLSIPNHPALVDLRLFSTWLVLDPKAPGNPMGLVSTKTGAAVLGL